MVLSAHKRSSADGREAALPKGLPAAVATPGVSFLPRDTAHLPICAHRWSGIFVSQLLLQTRQEGIPWHPTWVSWTCRE